jgi:hypothetical protein
MKGQKEITIEGLAELEPKHSSPYSRKKRTFLRIETKADNIS